jgi:hypothetical protein
MSKRITATLTMLLGVVLISPLIATATQPNNACEQGFVEMCPTTTEGGTTTTSEVTTSTSEGGTTTTVGEGTTSLPSPPSTTVVVNPICVDCNNATQADLQQLTGVNATLALAIIANRPYENLQDLVDKGVMTPGQLLLILVVNVGTGAFAGPECLSVTPTSGSTTTVTSEPTTTTTESDDTLPLTGINTKALVVVAVIASGLGMMLVGTKREDQE